ncbi:hypothetical protein SAMN05216317_11213 [Nitrosomonas eutropha]|nr:hypothetical protein SAMN05216317_11213 [Nitrosomonas eutropha]
MQIAKFCSGPSIEKTTRYDDSKFLYFKQYGLHREMCGVRTILSGKSFSQGLDNFSKIHFITFPDSIDDRVIIGYAQRLLYPQYHAPVSAALQAH